VRFRFTVDAAAPRPPEPAATNALLSVGSGDGELAESSAVVGQIAGFVIANEGSTAVVLCGVRGGEASV
jgi:hypothetical protein